MMAAFSQYEESMIVPKLKGARARAKAKDPSRHEGRKIFGTRAGEQDKIKRIQQLSGDGLPVSAICRILNEEKRPTRGGQE